MLIQQPPSGGAAFQPASAALLVEAIGPAQARENGISLVQPPN